MRTTQHLPPVRAAQPRASRPPQRSTNRWRRRLRNYLRAVFVRGDFSSLLMVWGIMIATALAVDAAEWTDGLGSLAVVSFSAVGFGFLLSRSHYSELVALILSTVYSIANILVINALLLVDHGALWERTDSLLRQIKIWLDEAFAGSQPANDNVAFVVFLSVLFWFLGHNAAWHVFRVDRVWRVIVPTGLVLITNQFYYQGETSLDIYLVIFVLLSLLLLIRSHIDTREYEWFVHRVSFPNYVRRTFFQAGGILSLILVLVAWNAPAGQDDKSLDRVQKLFSQDSLTELAELWNRLFSSLEGEGIATTEYYGGEELQLSGAIQLGDRPVMYVEAPFGPRYYWWATTYDSYDFSSGRWRHVRTVRASTDDPGLRLNLGPMLPGVRQEVEQKFTMLLRSSDLVYAAPLPVVLDLPVEAELDCVEDFGRTCVNENRPSDVSIIWSRKTLRANSSYSVTSSISTASASMLRSAGVDYPNWVLRLYLQGADQVPPRVRDLASQIIADTGANNPYDKAKAIERWLRINIQYNESIPTPPSNIDPVEWFLFDARQGYCNYYASAMILMLRSQGVPTRMAAGFAQGAWDETREAYLVRERDAHTWVEVYFPGYGWVEFEPTADEAPLERQDDQLPQTILPTVTPLPSPTPLPSATPTIAIPTQESGADATPTSVGQAPFMPSTPTPTPALAPTATTPPPPELTKVGGDSGTSVLEIVLITLGILALVILTLVLAAAFVIWYVEYRGLGGLNTVQRAYARMAIYADWLGLRFFQSATPEERRQKLVDEIPEGSKPINAITRTYVEDRYAPPDRNKSGGVNSQIAQQAWQEARRTFIRRKLAQFLGRDHQEPID
ncbi:MAG: transglutaminase domain-containing protein [Chloroflexi bacterium]|nr:transglutaminase domain-containing protein [Chloroflexota bacterium]